jgi:predicted NBD/HSP70 family sugar kinase
MGTLYPSLPTVTHGARPGLVREVNLNAVVDRLATDGPMSRADLARDLGLSPTSVGRLVEELLRLGLAVEGDRVAIGVGRPQTLLHLRAAAASVAGVSIRSRWVRVRLADLDGRVVATANEERHDGGAEGLARQVDALIARLRAAAAPACPLAALVIGISGAWDGARRRVFAAPNLSLLEGVDALAAFRAATAGQLGDGAIALDNDVKLAAIGERAFGAARGIDDVFYLSIGSGVGGAAIVGGAIHRGASGFGGEVGYLPVTVDGREMRLEDVLGRRPLEAFARGLGFRTDGDVLAWLEHDEPEHQPLTEHVARVLAQALVAVVTTVDPRLIVLGGSLGRYGRAWTERTRELLAERVPVVPAIASTRLGREAPLLGAIENARTLARSVLVSGAVAPSAPHAEATP